MWWLPLYVGMTSLRESGLGLCDVLANKISSTLLLLLFRLSFLIELLDGSFEMTFSRHSVSTKVASAPFLEILLPSSSGLERHFA